MEELPYALFTNWEESVHIKPNLICYHKFIIMRKGANRNTAQENLDAIIGFEIEIVHFFRCNY
jgi:hypothetical protein